VTWHTTGYRLTEFGQQLLPYAERTEAAVGDLERRVGGTADDLSGALRVTCPEPIIYRMIQAKLIDRFHEQHPRLRVEFVTSDRYLDLSKGEADVAFARATLMTSWSAERSLTQFGRSMRVVPMSSVMVGRKGSKTWRNILLSASTTPSPIIGLRNGCRRWRRRPGWRLATAAFWVSFRR
jgi:DNA-binding transcriptional LysR family regulator